MTKSICICCNSCDVLPLLDFGQQPPSNRFLQNQSPGADKHSLKFGICDNCEHMQLIEPMSSEMVRSRYDWITYNEPEGHLDDVVSRFLKLSDFDLSSKVTAVTYKDDTVLSRLERKGFNNLYRLDPVSDFSIHNNAGLEIIQGAVTTDIVKNIVSKIGRADLVLARHILEHTHHPVDFIAALKLLVRKDGYLVFEVPDSEKFMSSFDYPFIWEEHISYYTENSLRSFIEKQNLQLVSLFRYEYTFEDSLVVITKVVDEQIEQINSASSTVRELAQNYANKFPIVKNCIRNKLKQYTSTGKKIGLFGAGHLAVKYLNFFDLSGYIEIVIDDNSDKKGLFMPGSCLPVVSSSYLDDIDICLLSLSPESEEKVLNKYNSFIEKGGEFRSIFASSPISLIGSADI